MKIQVRRAPVNENYRSPGLKYEIWIETTKPLRRHSEIHPHLLHSKKRGGYSCCFSKKENAISEARYLAKLLK